MEFLCMRKSAPLIIAILALGSAVVEADAIKLDMKPGLWENSFKMTGDSAKEMQAVQGEQMKQAMEQMKQQLANMPPEQRKQMEAMMAQSGMKLNDEGVSFKNDKVKVSSEGSVVKECITKEQIAKGELPEENEDCKTTLTQISKNHFKSKHVCTGDSASVGESDVVFHSPTHYTGKGKSTQTINGLPHTVEVAMEGKWLSKDCGDILPD
jgi:hypothetical protein